MSFSCASGHHVISGSSGDTTNPYPWLSKGRVNKQGNVCHNLFRPCRAINSASVSSRAKVFSNTLKNSFVSLAACSETLFNTSGYFFSPLFPGFYLDESYCTWHITVPEQNIIRLTFHEFRLNDHPTCEDCFVEIFDGSDDTAPSIGRFCGYSYPPILSSSSNHFSVVLRCQGKPFIARFKAFYFSVAGTLQFD